jgi:CheY-like chemotaxis protein
MPTQHSPRDAVHVEVLIVENESLVSDYVEDILEGTRFDVVGVADAVPDAVAMAAHTRPRVALVDLTLRERLDGLEAARVLHERFGTVVVLVTGSPGAEQEARAAVGSSLPLVRKPFLPRQLLHALNAAANEVPQ